MTAPTDPQALAATALLAEAYQRTLVAVRARIVAFVEATWGSLAAWRDDDIDRFVTAVVPVVTGGQQQVSALTAAYLAQQRAAALGVPVRSVGVPASRVTGAAVRNGTPPADVYRRAGVQVWTDLSAGKPLSEAVDAGRRRAAVAAQTDLQLAKTHTARAVMADDERVVGYERTLTGDQNCALCVIASTQRYHKENLLPIHPGCDCSTRALYGQQNPGQVLNRERVELTHAAIEERFGTADRGGRTIDYRKLVVVQQHGETGPTLTVAGHNWTGPEAIETGLDLTGLPGR